jgi:poly(hydroxyalkanoate) granule-associated protein
MVTRKSTKQEPLTVIQESAQDIWLAGLGAFSTASEEGGKLFKQLVKGETVQKENKVLLTDLTERVSSLKEDAKGAVKNLSAPVEAGITSAMHRLGVPTRAEIMNLTKRVEELTKAVAKTKTEAKAKPAATKARPAAKPKTATEPQA